MNYFYSNEENALTDNKAIICFSAKWCTPCKKITELVGSDINNLSLLIINLL
jgi:hypothetical protein